MEEKEEVRRVEKSAMLQLFAFGFTRRYVSVVYVVVQAWRTVTVHVCAALYKALIHMSYEVWIMQNLQWFKQNLLRRC